MGLVSEDDQLKHLQPWMRLWAQYAMDYMQLVSGGRYDVSGRIVGGVRPIVTSGYRTWQRQAELRAAYERGESKYPVNRPGDSSHNWGMGFDSDVPDRWMPTWIAVRRAVGLRVPDNDEVHADYAHWRDLVAPFLPKS